MSRGHGIVSRQIPRRASETQTPTLRLLSSEASQAGFYQNVQLLWVLSRADQLCLSVPSELRAAASELPDLDTDSEPQPRWCSQSPPDSATRMPAQGSSRRWAACRSRTGPLEPNSEQAPAARQPDSQAPVAWLVDRYRHNKQIEARTAIHLRKISKSYAESIRIFTKSFQNPGRTSQKLLQILCRIYQKLHQISPESSQNMPENYPNPMRNPCASY